LLEQLSGICGAAALVREGKPDARRRLADEVARRRALVEVLARRRSLS